MVVNKENFAKRMAKIGGIKRCEAAAYVDLFIETLIACLSDEDIIKFRGIGRFELKTINEKLARNPKTGEKCIVPLHKKVKFYASDGLADQIEKIQGKD